MSKSSKDIRDVELYRIREDLEFTVFTMKEFYRLRNPQMFTRPHRLRFCALVYITEGRSDHYIDYQLYRIKPGTILFLSRYQVHRFDLNPEMKGYVIPFHDEFIYNGHDDPLKSKIQAAMEEINCIHNPGQKHDHQLNSAAKKQPV